MRSLSEANRDREVRNVSNTNTDIYVQVARLGRASHLFTTITYFIMCIIIVNVRHVEQELPMIKIDIID